MLRVLGLLKQSMLMTTQGLLRELWLQWEDGAGGCHEEGSRWPPKCRRVCLLSVAPYFPHGEVEKIEPVTAHAK